MRVGALLLWNCDHVHFKETSMRMSIKLVRALDGATVHERVVDVSEDGRIGKFVDEMFEKVWPELRQEGPGRYRMTIEKGEQTAIV